MNIQKAFKLIALLEKVKILFGLEDKQRKPDIVREQEQYDLQSTQGKERLTQGSNSIKNIAHSLSGLSEQKKQYSPLRGGKEDSRNSIQQSEFNLSQQQTAASSNGRQQALTMSKFSSHQHPQGKRKMTHDQQNLTSVSPSKNAEKNCQTNRDLSKHSNQLVEISPQKKQISLLSSPSSQVLVLKSDQKPSDNLQNNSQYPEAQQNKYSEERARFTSPFSQLSYGSSSGNQINQVQLLHKNLQSEQVPKKSTDELENFETYLRQCSNNENFTIQHTQTDLKPDLNESRSMFFFDRACLKTASNNFENFATNPENAISQKFLDSTSQFEFSRERYPQSKNDLKKFHRNTDINQSEGRLTYDCATQAMGKTISPSKVLNPHETNHHMIQTQAIKNSRSLNDAGKITNNLPEKEPQGQPAHTAPAQSLLQTQNLGKSSDIQKSKSRVIVIKVPIQKSVQLTKIKTTSTDDKNIPANKAPVGSISKAKPMQFLNSQSPDISKASLGNTTKIVPTNHNVSIISERQDESACYTDKTLNLLNGFVNDQSILSMNKNHNLSKSIFSSNLSPSILRAKMKPGIFLNGSGITSQIATQNTSILVKKHTQRSFRPSRDELQSLQFQKSNAASRENLEEFSLLRSQELQTRPFHIGSGTNIASEKKNLHRKNGSTGSQAQLNLQKNRLQQKDFSVMGEPLRAIRMPEDSKKSISKGVIQITKSKRDKKILPSHSEKKSLKKSPSRKLAMVKSQVILSQRNLTSENTNSNQNAEINKSTLILPPVHSIAQLDRNSKIQKSLPDFSLKKNKGDLGKTSAITRNTDGKKNNSLRNGLISQSKDQLPFLRPERASQPKTQDFSHKHRQISSQANQPILLMSFS